MADIDTMFKTDVKLPEGMRYSFTGQAENFQELMANMIMAAILGILFIYLVLASLYESFITPLTILFVLPLAAIGAFFALAITQESLNIFSMIGCVMLMGVATKNSILLVDYSNQLIGEGMSMKDAVIRAGKVRLRPILMTTFALIAGMLPLLVNLIGNAIKYSRKHTKVLVKVKSDAQFVNIAIADTGPGIPAGQIPTLFDNF